MRRPQILAFSLTKVCFSILIVVTISKGEVALKDFYPFGPSAGDAAMAMMDDGSSGQLELGPQTGFPFFNDTYISLWVNVNGAISFRKDEDDLVPSCNCLKCARKSCCCFENRSPCCVYCKCHSREKVNCRNPFSTLEITQYTPTCSALNKDSTMIAPYWTDIQLRKDHPQGQLYYRQSFNASLLSRAETQIKQIFTSLYHLRLKWLFIATWYNVTMYMPCTDYPTNTFQTILATDGIHSFALFFYNCLSWTTGRHHTSGGNCQGLGGIGAKAGFDTGDGKTFYQIRYSCSQDILKLVNETNVKGGSAGVWAFRVDKGYIEDASGTCNDEKYIKEKVTIHPAFVQQSGNEIIKIVGLCLNKYRNTTTSISCSFIDGKSSNVNITIPALGVDNESSVYCQVPLLKTTGRYRLILTIVRRNQNETRHYEGYLYSTSDEIDVLVDFVLEAPPTLRIRWDKKLVAEDSSSKVNISVLVHLLNGSTIEPIKWTNVNNTGKFVGSMETVQRKFIDATDMYVKIVPVVDRQIRRKRSLLESGVNDTLPIFGAKVARSLWTRKIVCSKNTVDHFRFGFGSNNNLRANERCNSWYESDPGVDPKGIEPCPPNHKLASVDPRFTHESWLSRLFIDHDEFHPGHGSSFRQTIPSPSGAGQQCVYDRAGKLMVDGPGRSTIDAVSIAHSTSGHNEKDVQSFCDCCKYGSPGQCEKYFEKRPADDGTKYVPPSAAKTVGDPHFTTFDTAQYLFNGKGEFWMIFSNNTSLSVQVRLEAIGSSATVPTAYVLVDHVNKVKIQVEYGAGQLHVFLDGELISFSESVQKDQELSEGNFSIKMKPDKSLLIYFSDYKSSFHLRKSFASINLIASGSVGYIKSIQGLLGNFDTIFNNDFSCRNGSILKSDSSARDIHYNFGLSWIVLENDTLFDYPLGRNHSSYYDPDFTPYFGIPSNFQFSHAVLKTCQNSSECLFDFAATGSLELAQETKIMSDAFDDIQLSKNEFPVWKEKRLRESDDAKVAAASASVLTKVLILPLFPLFVVAIR